MDTPQRRPRTLCNSMELPYTEPISRERLPSILKGSNVGSAQSIAKIGALETKTSSNNHSPQLYSRPHSMW